LRKSIRWHFGESSHSEASFVPFPFSAPSIRAI
jgi:hypothetical protein